MKAKEYSFLSDLKESEYKVAVMMIDEIKVRVIKLARGKERRVELEPGNSREGAEVASGKGWVEVSTRTDTGRMGCWG
jgi:hypothetical protein